MIIWGWNTAAPIACPLHNMFSFKTVNEVLAPLKASLVFTEISFYHPKLCWPSYPLCYVSKDPVWCHYHPPPHAPITNSVKHYLFRCSPCQPEEQIGHPPSHRILSPSQCTTLFPIYPPLLIIISQPQLRQRPCTLPKISPVGRSPAPELRQRAPAGPEVMAVCQNSRPHR